MGSDDSLMSNRQQTIIWTNDGPVYWRIYASLGLDELMEPQFMGLLPCKSVMTGVTVSTTNIRPVMRSDNGVLAIIVPATPLFVHQLVQANSKENIKTTLYWPIVRGIHRSPVDSLTKGQ